MKNKTKDAVYIIEQPKHLILSIVYVDNEFPKTKEIQETIDELTKETDIFFVIDQKSLIDPRKYTSLHRGIGYIVRTTNPAVALFNILEYAREIFRKHISYLVMNDKNLKDNMEENISTINNSLNWTAETITKPVLNITRKNPEDLWDIYKLEYKRNWLGQYKRVSKVSGGDYITHTSTSNILFFKDLIVSQWFEKKNLDKYIETFNSEDVREVIASLLVDLGIKNLENIGHV